MSSNRISAIQSSPSRLRAAAPKEAKSVARFPTAVIRVCVLSLDPLRVSGLRALFGDHAGIEIVVDDTTAPQVARCWLDPAVQVVVLGAQMGKATPKTIHSVRLARPDLPVVVMSPAAGEEAVLAILALGVKGFLHDSASPADFEKAVRVVASGGIWASRQAQARLIDRLLRASETNPAALTARFTKREQEVLGLLLDGRSNREIATSLRIEERTVKAYVARLMTKVGVKNRISLSMRTLSTVGLGS